MSTTPSPISQQPNPEVDSYYSGLVDQQRQIGQNLAVTAGDNPDQAGEAQRLAQRFGVSPQLVQDNLVDFRRQANVQDALVHVGTGSSPILRQQLEDPNFAAIAHDQIDNLSATEKIFNWAANVRGDVPNQYQAGKLQYERGLLGNRAQEGRATPDDFRRIREIDEQLKGLGPQKTLFGGLSNLAGTMVPQGGYVAGGAGVGAVLGGLTGLLGGPFAETTVPAGAIEGAKFGGETMMGERAYTMTSGNAYLDMLDKGINQDTAKYASAASGIVGAMLQVGGAKAVGAIPGVSRITSAAGDLISRATGAEIADAMTQPTVNRAVRSTIGGFLASSAQGGSLMAGQELANRLALNAAELHDTGKFDLETDEGRAEFGRALGQAFVNGAMTIGSLHAATGMIGFAADMAKARDAQQTQEFFNALQENAADSKVRERNPASYEGYIAAQARGGPAETMYIDGRQMAGVLAQSGLDPERVERVMPGLNDQVNEAAATGGDVEIPTEQYAARLAGTDLGKAMLPHVRLDPDAMSAQESADWLQDAQSKFDEARKSAEQQMTVNQAFAQSAKNVESNIFDQLKATGTMPNDAARTNAQFVRDFIVTQAARTNMMPEDFFDRYKYTILPQEAADRLRQGDAGTARGGFDPATMTTLLGQNADMSTFLHETGHYFLSVYSDLAAHPEAPPEVKADMDSLLRWFGVKDLDTWRQMSLEAQRPFHEQFAYNFERYLAEGRAPSKATEGIFSRFAQWLKRAYVSIRDDVNSIYKREHGKDLPIMTGEARGVMDRMLASEEQIREREAIEHMVPMFRTPEEAGMNTHEWAAYQEMHREASEQAANDLNAASMRQMQWLNNARGRLLREMQRQHDALWARTREQVAEEIGNEDLYRAQRFLKKGEMRGTDGEEIEAFAGHKIDVDKVKAMFPESALGEKPDLGKLRGMMKKGGTDPEIIAPMFGFDNAEQMVRQIADARPIDEEIDARTDQRMLAEHGDMNTADQREAAIQRALHNEARARFVGVELRHLEKATRPVRDILDAAKAAAQQILATKKIGDIDPREYEGAEARAARAAMDAMAKGDSAGAARAKRQQMLQNSLAREAQRVREKAESQLNYLSKFGNPTKAIAKSVGADFMDRINELVAGYQLGVRETHGSDARPLNAWVNDYYDKNGVMPAVSEQVMANLGRMHWKDMTPPQLDELHDAVKSLYYMGRREQTAVMNGAEVELSDLVRELRAPLADLPHDKDMDIRANLLHGRGAVKISAKFLDLKSGIRSLDAGLLKMEQLFQWFGAGKFAGLREAPIDGAWAKLFKMASDAEASERSMRAESGKVLRALGEQLRGTNINLDDVLDVPEMPRMDRGGSTQWYREELLAAAFNMGNFSNKQKMLDYYHWQEYEVVGAFNRLLSKPQMDFVQGGWDHINSFGERIFELQRRMTGVTPKMIEPSPLKTKWGTYRGGYYPMVYDSFYDRSIEEKNARNADRLFENNYANPSTDKGHTIDRTGYTGPVKFSLSVIAKHLDQVTHDLAWREPIVDMNKALSDGRVTREIDETWGRAYSKQLRPWLQAMANNRVFDTSMESAWENMYRRVRSNATMVGIGLRMQTVLTHGATALSNSFGEVGGKWFMKGVEQFMGLDRVKATRDFVYERSPEMAHRMDEADRNLHEAIDEINRHQESFRSPTAAMELFDKVRKFAYRGVMISDMASALPTWMGAYLKGMAKKADGGLDLSEDDAIDYANRTVRNAHGGGGVKDLAQIQRAKGAMSLATLFYSYWNHVYQRQRDLGMGWAKMVSGKGTVSDMPRLMARSLFYFAIPQLAHAFFSTRQNKDDDNTLGGFARRVGEETALGMVSGLPVFRDMATALVEGKDYKISPLEEAGQSFVTTTRDAYHLATGLPVSKHSLQTAANTAGYAFGLPLSQPAATTKFLWDYTDGDADPQTLKEWYEGVLTGHIH